MSNWIAAETQPSPYDLSASYIVNGFIHLCLSVKRNSTAYLMSWQLLLLAVISHLINYYFGISTQYLS
jgi:hypothetical protein